MDASYDGRQVVGMDLYRRSVLVRMTEDGRKLETVRITNSARMVKTAEGTSISLTRDGRAALKRYTLTLRSLLDAVGQTQPQ